MKRNDWALCCCAALFVCLIVLKLAFPAEAAAFSREVQGALPQELSLDAGLRMCGAIFEAAEKAVLAAGEAEPSAIPASGAGVEGTQQPDGAADPYSGPEDGDGSAAEEDHISVPDETDPEDTEPASSPDDAQPEGGENGNMTETVLPADPASPEDAQTDGERTGDDMDTTRESFPDGEESETPAESVVLPDVPQPDEAGSGSDDGTQPSPGEEAQAAFLESQSVFGLALPEAVDAQYRELPFSWTWPVPGVTSSGFGYRVHPVQDVVKFHYGTDIAAPMGTQALAFADGSVAMVSEDPEGYGLFLLLSHESGYLTLYAHCSEILVSPGETVTLGQPVALVGQSGMATGPHLHFELRQGEHFLDPEYYAPEPLPL